MTVDSENPRADETALTAEIAAPHTLLVRLADRLVETGRAVQTESAVRAVTYAGDGLTVVYGKQSTKITIEL